MAKAAGASSAVLTTRTATSARGVRIVGAAVAVAVAAVFASTAGRGSAAQTPFSLTFEGAHFADSTLPGGLRHDGRFTASPPFCAAGRAYDVQHVVVEPLTVHRVHTCDDGSGSFTALMPVVRGEHGGTGAWQIIDGTGSYATLRGTGTYAATLTSGDPNAFETIEYGTEWRGVVDFDADPPAIEKFTATARKLRLRARTYSLRIGVTVRDIASPISYTVDIRAGRAALGFERGSTASGQATISLRLHPARSDRSARILLTVRDALGNEATASRSVRLR